jgi:glycerophosphoryl diester phosphodiesterase
MLDFSNRPLVIGHRGARGLYPENTLDGFSHAIRLGVEGIEFDVAVSADGSVVVTHDLRLNPDIVRGAGGRWLDPPTPRVRDLSFAQLRAYDVGRLRPGSAYARQFQQQQSMDGAGIPRLQEVFSLDPTTLLLIEMKTSPQEPDLTVRPAEMAELIIDGIKAAGAISRSMILSFDWRGLRHLRRHHPEVATGWLTEEMNDAERRLWCGDELAARFNGSTARVITEEGGHCWLPEFRELREGDVEAAQRLGLWVIPWNVDRAEDITRAVEWGVDGLITDRPDIALELRVARTRSATPGPSEISTAEN